MNKYDWKDLYSNSAAENLRSQYRNLMYYLDREIPTLKNNFLDVESLLNNGYKVTDNGVSNCEGVVPELLLSSLNKSKKEFMAILSSMDTAIDALIIKQSTVEDRVEQLNWYCSNEDIREKEYSNSNIYLD